MELCKVLYFLPFVRCREDQATSGHLLGGSRLIATLLSTQTVRSSLKPLKMSQEPNSAISISQSSSENAQHEQNSTPVTRSPRRRALAIGIKYFGQKGQLAGGVDHVMNMCMFINQNYGFHRDDIVILTDDQQNPMNQPTKANIIRAMAWLVKDAQASDCMFLYYSGHGGQTVSTDADDDDGYDECIYPVDFRSAGHLLDENMHQLLVRSLPPGARLTAVFDSPHKDSPLDLPYIYSIQGLVKDPTSSKLQPQGLHGLVSAYATGEMSALSALAAGLFKRHHQGKKSDTSTTASPADVMVLFGTKDSPRSQKAEPVEPEIGSIAPAFIAALKKNNRQSSDGLLHSLRHELSQTSNRSIQLSCSHPLNMDLLFVI